MRLIWTIALCACAYGQGTPGKEAPANESKGMPPRVSPSEYQAHGEAGTVTIAAEFTGHAIGTAQGTLTTEDYVVVETGFFGAAGARTKLAADDFTLRINGKKVALPSQPYGMVLPSLKDPEWEPPADTKSKGKTQHGRWRRWWWWPGRRDRPSAHASQDAIPGTARDGAARSESCTTGRRPRASRGGTDFLSVSRED